MSKEVNYIGHIVGIEPTTDWAMSPDLKNSFCLLLNPLSTPFFINRSKARVLSIFKDMPAAINVSFNGKASTRHHIHLLLIRCHHFFTKFQHLFKCIDKRLSIIDNEFTRMTIYVHTSARTPLPVEICHMLQIAFYAIVLTEIIKRIASYNNTLIATVIWRFINEHYNFF